MKKRFERSFNPKTKPPLLTFHNPSQVRVPILSHMLRVLYHGTHIALHNLYISRVLVLYSMLYLRDDLHEGILSSAVENEHCEVCYELSEATIKEKRESITHQTNDNSNNKKITRVGLALSFGKFIFVD